MALLWPAEDETSDTGMTTVLLVNRACCAVGTTGLAVAVVLWQSADQVCREVEAADAASVARLVRGRVLLSRCPERTVAVSVSVMCMLVWRWL